MARSVIVRMSILSLGLALAGCGSSGGPVSGSTQDHQAASAQSMPITVTPKVTAVNSKAKSKTMAAKPASPKSAATPAKTVATVPSSQRGGRPGLVMSLGAGDSLGQAVYVNDVILAAKAAKSQTQFADVQPKSNEGN